MVDQVIWLGIGKEPKNLKVFLDWLIKREENKKVHTVKHFQNHFLIFPDSFYKCIGFLLDIQSGEDSLKM